MPFLFTFLVAVKMLARR